MKRGFTLVELMITVMIVGLLASIAGPRYFVYALRARAAEASTLLGNLSQAQQAFFATNDDYANVTESTPSGVPSGERRSWNPQPCATECRRGAPEECTSFTCLGWEPGGNVYHTFVAPHQRSAAGVPGEFAAGALGDLDSDAQTGSFAYRSANSGDVGVLEDGISGCPANIPAGLVINCTPVAF